MTISGGTSDFKHWVWECVLDPTRADNYPGDFLHGRFRLCDLKFSADFHVWPEGIAFRHIRNGATMRYQNGQLVQA